jgi:hypothetical protein
MLPTKSKSESIASCAPPVRIIRSEPSALTPERRSVRTAASNAVAIRFVNPATTTTSRTHVCGSLSRTNAIHSQLLVHCPIGFPRSRRLLWAHIKKETQQRPRAPDRRFVLDKLKPIATGDDLTINDLIQRSWQMYAGLKGQPFLVKPSIPILFFGDSNRYFSSQLKVITLGLNPSRIEFPESDRFLRFDSARRVYPRILSGDCYDEYLQTLNGYFYDPPNHPYKPWFNSFEPMLRGLDCSYYGNASNTALHTDLCSPLATDPTWSNLSEQATTRLFECGTPYGILLSSGSRPT